MPLYIVVQMCEKRVPLVMINNGSAVNVCPLKMLVKLGMTTKDLIPSSQVIRAYDESRRVVEGTFKALVTMGLVTSEVEFLVMDIKATFTLLLG